MLTSVHRGAVLGRALTPSLFGVFGVMYGAWQVLLADLRRALDLSEGALGLALSIGFVASIPTMALAGRGIDRWGQRVVIAAAGAAMGLAWLGFAVVGGFLALVGLLLLFYSASGVYDVGINAAAMGVEQRTGRRVMTVLHGAFSAGGAVGALATGGLLAAGVPFRGVYVGVAGVLWGVMALAATGGDDAPPRRAARAHGRGERVGLFRDRGLLLLATITALAFLYEGVMETWSVIYLRDSLALPALVGASGAAVFHLAMMVGRFGTAGAVVRFGRVSVLRGAGVVAAVGMLLALATDVPAAILVGFLVVGLALSGVAPVTFSLAGDRAPERAGEASAVITTLGYGGFLLGPSLVGGLAELTGLRPALATGCLVGAAIAALAGKVGRPSPRWNGCGAGATNGV